MSYDHGNRVYGEVATGDLERRDGDGSGRADGERGSGDDGKGGVRLVAPAVACDHVDDGRLRKLGETAEGRRKAFQNAMAWLYSTDQNPDAWMIVEKTRFIVHKY